MGKINILDESIANQIAAGEVVERPAAIVKELIENSIDANSTEIDIDIYEGGIGSIRIKDNGEGIEEDDLEKAFFRHATSKIKTGKDLFRINSLGFRGEALPSIVAISRVSLKTATNNHGKGIEIKLEGGKVLSKKEIAFIKGTEIKVEDIFFNTPARLKYMKSVETEISHIIDYVNRLSLAYPSIAFSLKHNKRLILRTNGDGNLLHVLAAIYGSGIAKNMVEVKAENIDFKLSGFLSRPEITRANKSHISIFVNGRYIKNFLLAQTIIKAYKTLLMVNRYPLVVLEIEMDPSLIDVNVHPAKLEVRFSKEQELLKFIEEAVVRGLGSGSYIREPMRNFNLEKQLKPIQSTFDLQLKSNDKYSYGFNNGEDKNSTIVQSNFEIKDNSNEINEDSNLNIKESFEDNITNEQLSNYNKLPFLEPISQLQGTYIIAQNEKGLYLIDQHAAHERIQYEKNLSLIDEELTSSQKLLIPITLDYPKSEMEQIISLINSLQKTGLDIELFGQQTFIIREVPQWVPKGKEEEFIEKMIQMVIEDGQVNNERLRKELIANTSCKSAIKANHYLSKNEMEVLIEQLRKTSNPFTCPHGRPTIIHFSFYEIEKMFKRVV